MLRSEKRLLEDGRRYTKGYSDGARYHLFTIVLG
jgi:hypothetical protein